MKKEATIKDCPYTYWKIMTKPDFIIIGAMKSATSTLHSQLALQEGIFMTTPKEPNYFSDDDQYAKGETWYKSLFSEAKNSDLCGESSTHYTKLPHHPLAVKRMAKNLTSPKLIYVMRHPIDRLVSHYIHQWSQHVMTCDINKAINQYDELIAYGCYAQQLQPYIDQYGRENILCIFMESIKHNPQGQLEKVVSFVGYKGQARWQFELKRQNISKDKIRAFPGYKLLIDSVLMAWLRRKLVPQSIRNKIKKRFTMQNRPEINSVNMAKLTKVFDQDLQRLSAILGCDNLTCENYKTVVLERFG